MQKLYRDFLLFLTQFHARDCPDPLASVRAKVRGGAELTVRLKFAVPSPFPSPRCLVSEASPWLRTRYGKRYSLWHETGLETANRHD